MPRTNCFYKLILPSPVKQWSSPRRLSIYSQQDRTAWSSTDGTYIDGEVKNFSFEDCPECGFSGFDCSTSGYDYNGERVITHFDDDSEPILPCYVKISDSKLYNTLHVPAGYGREHNYPQIKGFLLDRNFEPWSLDSSYDKRFCITHIGDRVTKEKSSSVQPTNVYVMIDKNTGLYKIGRSTSPACREKTLQSEKPTIEMLFYNSGFHFDEVALHRKFADKRVRGEWFKLDADDISEVKSYFADKEDTDEEMHPDVELLFADGFDDAIIGVCDGRICYDKDLMVSILIERDNYVGEHTPMYIHTFHFKDNRGT